MANTYTLIASNTLGSSAASVTFSSIPATYTDLVVRISARADTGDTFQNLRVQINGNTGTVYSNTRLEGNGATASSARNSNASFLASGEVDGSTATSNTFASIEMYFPSYAASINKPISTFAAQENNTTTAYIRGIAGLFSSTTAISSIQFKPVADNFVSGSSFFLYGIKNS